jgi:predicted glycosyltransferase
MRILVYSHDSFGLGNIRRMLAICEYLHKTVKDASILIISGSPMLQGFRILQGIDYIKLPCLKRSVEGELDVRFLDIETAEIVRLRQELIQSTVASFRPDVVLVDKKPAGLAGELRPAMEWVRRVLPQTHTYLVLRDILDEPGVTIRQWEKSRAYEIADWCYDGVLVLGVREVFDVCAEYAFPAGLRRKVHFCGYVARTPPAQPREEMRHALGAEHGQPLVLVTAGGGEDGYKLLHTYLESLRLAPAPLWRSAVVTGPELPAGQAAQIRRLAAQAGHVRVIEFTDDMISCMNAADCIVSMGGYNTVCELLTLGKPAVVVPRARPVAEQQLRAERMAGLGLFRSIPEEQLEPVALRKAVETELARGADPESPSQLLDMGALPRIRAIVQAQVDVPRPALDPFAIPEGVY